MSKDNVPYKLAQRKPEQPDTVVYLGQLAIGGSQPVVIAGPCAVESKQQLIATAHAVKASGAHALRGGAYKPRTSPYDFQGLNEQGLQLLLEAKQATGLPIITEVMSENDVHLVGIYADMLQIGARNMQNFSLLKRAAQNDSARPILLKRGPGATIKEWLLAAEYIIDAGNPGVVLCERGIKTFETATRNTLDLSAVALVRQLSHLPVIVDPSHGTGLRSLIAPLSKAGLAVGGNGLMIEVHPEPQCALSDAAQQLNFDEFDSLMTSLSLKPPYALGAAA